MPAADGASSRGRRRRPFFIAAGAGALVFAVVAALTLTHVLDGLDTWVWERFQAHHRESLTDIARALDRLDTWWLLVLIVAGFVGLLWWTGRMVQAVYFGATVAMALVLNPLLKIVFQRRPPGEGSLAEAAAYAFPSGHATTATAIATSLAVIAWPTRWRWPMIAVAVLFSITMAISRVYLGVHWLSDVAGGLALGFAVAMLVRALVPWPSPAQTTAAHAQAPKAVRPADQGIDVVFLDWGNTLMVDIGMREGPMKDWEKVEAEAGAQEALQRLRDRYRLVVATNAEDSPAADVRLALMRVGLNDLVDDVVSSADVGDHKPNYAFFRAALLREGDAGLPLDPRRAVMVGDGTTNDVAGAQRAGMRTIWYNPTRRRFPDGAQAPDAVIRKLTDLPAAVDRLAGVVPERRSRKQRKADADAAAAVASEAAAVAAALRAATTAEDAAASAAAAETPSGPAAPDPGAGTSSPAGPTTRR